MIKSSVIVAVLATIFVSHPSRAAEIKVLAALPAASTGKILKHRLRDLV